MTDWDDLRRRLARLPRRASRARDLRRAAVLVPLTERGGRLEALFTRRLDTLVAHPGQVSFPGGSLDPGEDAPAAALREADEEVGLPPALVDPLGLLHDVETSTGFVLTPLIGRITDDAVELRPNPAEVARVFHAPLDALAARLVLRPMTRGGRTWQVPFFDWDGETIWGATGRVVLDLLRVLELVPADAPAPPRLAREDERT